MSLDQLRTVANELAQLLCDEQALVNIGGCTRILQQEVRRLRRKCPPAPLLDVPQSARGERIALTELQLVSGTEWLRTHPEEAATDDAA